MFESMAAFIENLQSRGRYTFTQVEALKADKRSNAALTAALRRLRHKGRIANPRRGFYVIIPAEYREAGCPPASWGKSSCWTAQPNPVSWIDWPNGDGS